MTADPSNSGSSDGVSTPKPVSAFKTVSSTPMAQETPNRLRARGTSSASRLKRPFKSPISTCNDAHTGDSPSREAVQRSLRGARSERQELEARLLLLQQTAKYLREDSLRKMPVLIDKWRCAGQAAAQDLWNLTGAHSSGTTGLAVKGDYGLESQSYSQEESQDRKRRYRDSSSPEATGPILQRRKRMSAGEEDMAAGLLAYTNEANGMESGSSSQGSLPEVAELLLRSQKLMHGSRTTAPTPLSETWTKQESENAALTIDSQPWNVGRMLDVIGANKSVLGWNAEDEAFQS